MIVLAGTGTFLLGGGEAAVLRAARETYARIEGRAAPFYALASALGVAAPLLVGALTGYATQGSLIAIGGYLVAFTTPEGPYGARARALATSVLVVTFGATVGGLVAGHPWLGVAVVPLVVALGTAVPWIGPIAGLAVLITAVRPAAHTPSYDGLLALLGGLWVSLLFLAPWPARRLQPLRTALSDAAAAVAEVLDAVAHEVGALDDTGALEAVAGDDPELAAVIRKPQWDERRRAASRALTTARVTYSLYRPSPSTQRPERFIQALVRTLNETVALHALVLAVRRRPPDREWALEVQVAIAALAARLRLLSGAIAASGQTPLGDTDSAAVRRLARQIEHIRRASLAGDDDIVAAALLGQVRNSIDRIAGAVESARRIAADELKIRPAAPRLLPGTSQPTTSTDQPSATITHPGGSQPSSAPTNQPAATTDQSAMTANQSAVTGDGPALTGDQSAASTDQYAAVARRSAVAAGRSAGSRKIGLLGRSAGVLGRPVRAVRTRSATFRQFMRAGLAVAVAMIVAAASGIPHGHWLTITVALSLRDTYGETVTRVVQRVAGTAIGAAIAAVLLALAPGQVAAALILFVCALFGFALRSVNYGYWALFGTPLVMMMLDFASPAGWTAAGERILLTLAGGVLALLAARLLWPAGTAERLPSQLTHLLTTHADLVRSAATVVGTPDHRLPADRLTAAEKAAEDITRARHHLAHEPTPDTNRVACLQDAIRAAQRIRDHLITIARMSRTDIEDTAPITNILDRIADHLEESAARLPESTTTPDPLDLTDHLTTLDKHLAALAKRRRAEITTGDATLDDTTPLRHALLHTAGVRHTLRSLTTDTNSLTTYTTKALPNTLDQ